MIYTILSSEIINSDTIQIRVRYEYEDEDNTVAEIDMAIFSPMTSSEVLESITVRGNQEWDRIQTASRLSSILSELPINEPQSE